MFNLNDGSGLVLLEKIEIYYNTNNVKEAIKFMIRGPPDATIQISPKVKIAFFSQKTS